MPSVVVYSVRGNGRSRKLAPSLRKGAFAAGYCGYRHWAPIKTLSDEYKGPKGDICAFYGYEKNMPEVMADYIKAGKKVVFVDLGYWGRARKSRLSGYHKVAVNGRHPGDYLMQHDLSHSRFKMFGLKVEKWRKGRHILIAGMSGRAAQSIGFEPEEWERGAIKEVSKHSDRPIIYRPKPTWLGSSNLIGARTDRSMLPDYSLKDCHAVVTHHSNVAIDGLIKGVPAFCFDGAAMPMASQDLSRIENPIMLDGRDQWLANVAWCQWTIDELGNGDMWRHLKSEGLIP